MKRQKIDWENIKITIVPADEKNPNPLNPCSGLSKAERKKQMGLVTTMKKKCYICNKDFSPEKRHPYQKVCNKDKCRREHKRRYCQKWRKKNPNYFKGWKRNIEVNKKWREKNPDYYKK